MTASPITRIATTACRKIHNDEQQDVDHHDDEQQDNSHHEDDHSGQHPPHVDHNDNEQRGGSRNGDHHDGQHLDKLIRGDYCFEPVPPLTITDPVSYFEEMLEKATQPAIRRCIQAAIDAAKSGVDTTGLVIVDGKLIHYQDLKPGMGLIFFPYPIVSAPINFSLSDKPTSIAKWDMNEFGIIPSILGRHSSHKECPKNFSKPCF